MVRNEAPRTLLRYNQAYMQGTKYSDLQIKGEVVHRNWIAAWTVTTRLAGFFFIAEIYAQHSDCIRTEHQHSPLLFQTRSTTYLRVLVHYILHHHSCWKYLGTTKMSMETYMQLDVHSIRVPGDVQTLFLYWYCEWNNYAFPSEAGRADTDGGPNSIRWLQYIHMTHNSERSFWLLLNMDKVVEKSKDIALLALLFGTFAINPQQAWRAL